MKTLLYAAVLILVSSCSGSFLEVKTDQSLVIPYRIEDYQAILDDAFRTMNTKASIVLGTIAADEIQVDEEQLANLTPVHQRNAYLWKKGDLFEGEQSDDWNFGYRRILYANQVIEGIQKIKPDNAQLDAWSNVRGSALFFRAFNYYQLAQLFCEVYDEKNAKSQLGLPLRTEPDISLKIPRSTLQQTYDLILKDLNEAEELLPIEPTIKQRPSRLAVSALRARIYLQLRRYDLALTEANAVLGHKNTLLDFNTVPFDPNSFATLQPLATVNPEIIFDFSGSIPEIQRIGLYCVNQRYFDKYQEGDLRKKLFFKDFNNFKIFIGSTSFSGGPLYGFAVDELQLIAAECDARAGNLNKALDRINTLRKNRFEKHVDYELHSSDKKVVMQWILEERQRELVFRGLRWEDLRRLNKEMEYPITLEKTFNSELIRIEPNDPRYVFPIPPNAIAIGGYEQNSR